MTRSNPLLSSPRNATSDPRDDGRVHDGTGSAGAGAQVLAAHAHGHGVGSMVGAGELVIPVIAVAGAIAGIAGLATGAITI